MLKNNINTIAALVLGAVIGYGVAQWNNGSMVAANEAVQAVQADDSTVVKALRDELALLRAEAEQTRWQLAQLQAGATKQANSNSQLDFASADEAAAASTEREAPGEYSVAFQQTLTLALKALNEGDLDQATQLFNKLANEAETPIEKTRAQAGQFDVLQTRLDQLKAAGGQSNIALWTLFEMQKLRPTESLRNEMFTLSEQVNSEAVQFRAQGDLLSAADRYRSLMHLTNMLNYDVLDANGNAVDTAAFRGQVQEIEAQAGYQAALTARAENNLYNGSDWARSSAFWDYTNLVKLTGADQLAPGTVFYDQFVQATVAHLGHLERMNQTGDLHSRMDYIRFSFPSVMRHPEVEAFQQAL